MAEKRQEKIMYYSPKKILETNSTYNVIIGERSNGKTYSILKYAIEEYFKNGGQLAIVRRWSEDIKGRRAADIFASVNENLEVAKISNGKFQGITYYNRKFYMCTYDENGKPIYNLDTDCFGYTFSLSESEHNKSISYPKITTIMFDEFLTNKLYLPDEFVSFMNTVSTIIRQRTNVKIFMLGNTVNKYSPYFKEMGLKHITDMKQGSIEVYTYGQSELRVAVEYCGTNKTLKKNNYYFAFDNPKLNMITNGAWELALYPHLPEKYKPKQIIFTFFILFEDETYQCEVVESARFNGGEYFIFIHLKTTPLQDTDNDLIYSLEYNYKLNYNRSIFKPINQLQKRIEWFFKTDRVFYQDNSVGDAINNYLKICRTQL